MDTLRQDTTLGKNLNIGHIWAHFYQQMAWEKTWLFGHLFPISYTVSVSNSASRDFCWDSLYSLRNIEQHLSLRQPIFFKEYRTTPQNKPKPKLLYSLRNIEQHPNHIFFKEYILFCHSNLIPNQPRFTTLVGYGIWGQSLIAG